MADDTITMHLPDGLHHRLEHLAHVTNRPLEELNVKTLSSSLPPLPDDLSAARNDSQ